MMKEALMIMLAMVSSSVSWATCDPEKEVLLTDSSTGITSCYDADALRESLYDLGGPIAEPTPKPKQEQNSTESSKEREVRDQPPQND